MNKLALVLGGFLFLAAVAFVVQWQSRSSDTSVSSSSSKNSLPTPAPTASPPKQQEKVVVVVEAPKQQQQQQQQQQQLTCPPTSPPAPETPTEQQQKQQQACPANRFTERYFTTDPLAIRFKELGYDGTKPLNENVQKVSSTKMHTGSGIPEAFKQLLYNQFTKDGGEKVKVEENSDKYFSGEKAVDALEAKCGWDGIKGVFTKDPECLKEFVTAADGGEKKISQLKKFFESASSSSASENEPDYASMSDEELLRVAPQLMDIVVPSIRDLDFLQDWRDIIEGFHLIFVQDGDPSKMLKIPPWVDYELYNRNDINDALKSNAWIISQKDASIRNFGFLVSKKKFIYTLDDDTFPVMTHELQSFGRDVVLPESEGGCSTQHPRDLIRGSNPILMHLRNLLSPSTPFFMNTLYDGYRPGVDFVRGFPYSMRDGVSTVLSHGLWLNVPDYDAPTQLVKPQEKNTRHLDATLTVPAAVFYPMCSMNVAFDRKKIGAAFMQGLMGVGQPWARYDDMFAGWASKVVADHLAVGVKNGAPYIFHKKASNPFTNLKKEYKGLWWQEIVIAFCNRVQLPASANTAETAYRALAEAIRTELTPLHPYFDRLATAMNSWVDAWEDAEAGKLKFTPSRKSDPEEVKKHSSVDFKLKMDPNTSKNKNKPSGVQCVTADERYAECRRIKKQPVSMRREYFRRVAEMGRNPDANKEVVLVNLAGVSSADDFEKDDDDLWLSVCSIIVETSSKNRDVVILTSSSSSSLPSEFKPLSRSVFSNDLVSRLIDSSISLKKKSCECLADAAQASIFLQLHASSYSSAWVINAKSRVAGSSWNAILDLSSDAEAGDFVTLVDEKNLEPGFRISQKFAKEMFFLSSSSSSSSDDDKKTTTTLSSLDEILNAVRSKVKVMTSDTSFNYQVRVPSDLKNSFYNTWKSGKSINIEDLEKESDKDVVKFRNEKSKSLIVEDGKKQSCLVNFLSH